MKCKECTKKGIKSNVFIGQSSTTLMSHIPFYDYNGKYHNHDPNAITTLYSCSNGHDWSESSHSECWCGWGTEKIEKEK